MADTNVEEYGASAVEEFLRSATAEAPAPTRPVAPVLDDGPAGALVPESGPVRGKRRSPAVAADHGWHSPPVNDKLSTLPPKPVAIAPVVPIEDTFPGLPSAEDDPRVKTARKAHDVLVSRLQENGKEQAAIAAALGLPVNPTDAQIDSLNSAFIVAGKDESPIEQLRALRKREAVLLGACTESAGAVRTAIDAVRAELLPLARERLWLPAFKAAVMAHIEAWKVADELRVTTERLKGCRLGGGLYPMFPQMPSDMRDGSAIAAIVRAWVEQGIISEQEAKAALPAVMSGRTPR